MRVAHGLIALAIGASFLAGQAIGGASMFIHPTSTPYATSTPYTVQDAYTPRPTLTPIVWPTATEYPPIYITETPVPTDTETPTPTPTVIPCVIVSGDFNTSTGWTVTGYVSFVSGFAVFSRGNTPVTGVVSQSCDTQSGARYDLHYRTYQDGSCPGGAARGNAEVIDDATGSLIASQVNVSAGIHVLPFVASSRIRLRFTDRTPNTWSCDWWLDDVSVSIASTP